MMETLDQLKELCFDEPPTWEEAQRRLRAISADELAAWLQERVTNPAAERHLLGLFSSIDDRESCLRFQRELRLRLRPRLRRNVLGWGEISQVAEVAGSPVTAWRHPDSGEPMPVVYKKMPPFLSRADAEDFVVHYLEYNTTLRDKAGIRVPRFDARITEPDPERVLIFVIQERVNPASVCHEILKEIGPEAARRLYRLILGEYEKFFAFNQAQSADGVRLGLDGQIPNWAVVDYDGDPNGLTGEEELVYLDTNVPMMRIDGRDVVSADMYFQALPGGARWLIKRLNLDQEVMDRYFDIRSITLDFLGNIIVRHREDLVAGLVELSNQALAGPFAAGGMKPFTLEEVQKYYRSDVATWRLWRSLKLLGAMSDGVSSGNWRVLRRLGEFYAIWTKPIF